ncbi:MAG: cyclohexanone monooxygenase [Gammaproteobacteria bacterium]|jgi:cyclohexanone monooxygenase
MTNPTVSGTCAALAERVDVVVVGAGLAGLYILHCLRTRGLSARAFEAGSDVGGTWYWNRYPGARVDVESMQYSYNFSDELIREWTWTEKFAAQPELLRYINHVADRFDLRRDVKFNTRVTSALFDDETNHWTLQTEQGDVATAPYCIMATGSLSKPYRPPFPGLEGFSGDWYHTATWPHEEVDFAGKRVGIIGTGSTGIQAIPVVAAQAKHLTIFQRTANYSTPSRNRPLADEEQRTFNARREQWQDEVRHTFAAMTGFPVPRSHYDDTPQQRRRLLEERWLAGGMPQSMLATYKDINVDVEANALVANFIREKIRDIVKDPEVADILSPSEELPLGSKRPPIDTDYYETFNRDNVTLVDVKTAPIERVTANGINTSEAQYDLDAIIFATGFDAMTGTLLAIDIGTRAGVALKDLWTNGPVSYLGLMVAGMPNLFMINGPGSPSVKVNMIIALEQHTDWIMALLDHLGSGAQDRVEATDEAQAAWVEHTREVAEATLFAAPDSWYVGANIPGKKRVFMPYLGGFEKYWKLCEEIAAEGYRGFVLSRNEHARRVG